MDVLVYDGSFAGLLSAVFVVYEYKLANVSIQSEQRRQENLFGQTRIVETDKKKADRIWKGLRKKTSANALSQLYSTYLSEQAELEDMILRYIQYVFKSMLPIEKDYSNDAVWYVQETAKKVHREKHRME